MTTDSLIAEAIARRDAALKEGAEWDAFIRRYQMLRGTTSTNPSNNEVADSMRSPSKKAKTEVVIATIEAVRELITQAGKPLPTAELIADVQAKHIPLRGKSMRGTLDARLRYSDQFVSIPGRGWWIKDRPIPQCNGSAAGTHDEQPAAQSDRP